MFCSLNRTHNDTDHYVLQISSTDLKSVSIYKNGELITPPDCKLSYVIYGGFEPGKYVIWSNGAHVMYFIYKDGVDIESGIVPRRLEIELERYAYVTEVS